MFTKKTVALAVGASVGVFLAPRVLDMLNIEESAGFGMDDVARALVITASVLAVDAIF